VGTPPTPWYFTALDLGYPPAAGLGQGEKIAVVDTGFDSDGLGTEGPKVFAQASVMGDSTSAQDDNGHGTRMASIIASRGTLGVWGVAPGASLIVVKALDADGQGSPASVAAGINVAVASGANVISLSLATPAPSPVLAAAVEAAEAKGCIVVAAAGDEGAEGPDFPAADPGVVAVFGQSQDGEIAPSSNLPSGPAALAPGVGIEAIDNHVGASPTLVLADGTSAATAVDAGLLADCLSARAATPGRSGWCVSALMVHSPGAFVDGRSLLAVNPTTGPRSLVHLYEGSEMVMQPPGMAAATDGSGFQTAFREFDTAAPNRSRAFWATASTCLGSGSRPAANIAACRSGP
jgi:subtilisin family serine protease